jgi:ferredoxin-NADP reductase
LPFTANAVAHIASCDLFFLTATHPTSPSYTSTNHRGGPPGFVRILSNDAHSTTIAYPEYSGNRLYQTLGNLMLKPSIGLVFPDFETGNVLYVTGTASMHAGREAAALIPRSNLVVTIAVSAMRFVGNGLPFRGKVIDFSPYNPPVRYLAAERPDALPPADAADRRLSATLIEKERLTPTIARLRFRIDGRGEDAERGWKAGQYAALSFDDELGLGYSHMRDDDPTSLNDDLVRTWTVASAPVPSGSGSSRGAVEFEIIMRAVGRVTNYLYKFDTRRELTVPLLGFGGEFAIEQGDGKVVGFVAGGAGITPFLAQAGSLDAKGVRGFWAIRAVDLGLVRAVLERVKVLGACLKIFVSGIEGPGQETEDNIAAIETAGVTVVRRRLAEQDIASEKQIERWYLCTGVALRKSIEAWVGEKEVNYEDFGY